MGALCADQNGHPAKGIIVASDRMVTWGNMIEFEHEIPKISSISDRTVALIAGDALRGTQLVRDITQVGSGASTIQEIADAISQRYVENRRQQIQVEIFTPRCMDMAAFYQGQQQHLMPQLAGMIDQAAVSFDFEVSLLIAGVDDGGAHLLWITNPGGAVTNFYQIGFHAIGSGAIHAIQSAIGLKHNGNKGLAETLFTVYASKKRAEAAPGVGQDTDLLIITEKGVERVDAELMGELERLYEKYMNPSDGITKELANLKIGDDHIQKGEKKAGAK